MRFHNEKKPRETKISGTGTMMCKDMDSGLGMKMKYSRIRKCNGIKVD